MIISHGYIDNGVALAKFLKINKTAKIFVQRKVFHAHQIRVDFLKSNIRFNRKLKNSNQIVLLDENYKIDEELRLFIASDTTKCYSFANNKLPDEHGEDNFSYKQNVISKENQTALIKECLHAGLLMLRFGLSSITNALCRWISFVYSYNKEIGIKSIIR
ncbi:MAG: hypothetical protein ACK5KR_06480 [Breznakia sp.]